MDDEEGELWLLDHFREDGYRAGEWSLPGTFLHEGETLEQAVIRSLEEKMGISGARPRQLHVFDDPARDDRGWVISVAHVVLLRMRDAIQLLRARDDLEYQTVDGVLGLPFDHDEIVALAVAEVRQQYALLPDPYFLLGDSFTLKELQAVHEAIAAPVREGETRPHPDTFRRYMVDNGLVQRLDETRVVGRGRPAQLYTRSADSADLSRLAGVRPARRLSGTAMGRRP
ncbi:NUDIX hydrolase [Trujillonella humicola]|uniref:NUDIX hydrolase n=1 Tax=Trujillonella humicola TaxID=3383699 RepID=UPI0039059B05